MIILNLNEIGKSFGEQKLFHSVDMAVDERDKIGLIGMNGCGKTTLFQIILGRLHPDEGSIQKQSGLVISDIAQNIPDDAEQTAYDYALEAYAPMMAMEKELEKTLQALQSDQSERNIRKHAELNERFIAGDGLTYKGRTASALAGLGIDEHHQHLPLKALSGGQRSKVGLARMLMSGAGLLLLDEPTNHLDIEATGWLEDFLASYHGGFIVISHDRYFLDKVTNKTAEIEHGRLLCYSGSYSRFAEQKREANRAAEKDYSNKMREIRRIEDMIEQQRRFNQKRNYEIIASKQKQIDRIKKEMVEPEKVQRHLQFKLSETARGGKDLLVGRGLHRAYGERILYRDVNLHLKRGDRAFLLGPNGCGKTTLLRQLMDMDGDTKLGPGVKLGYFDQSGAGFDEAGTLLEEIHSSFPNMNQTQVRTALGGFLFTGDDVFKPVKALSGGERARAAILKLMLDQSDLLLLDEPTNHLDIYARTALGNALLEYGGTLLIISHDRYFINQLATKIYAFSGDCVDCYEGDYEFYLEKAGTGKTAEKRETTQKKQINTYRERKASQAELRRLKSQSLRLETELEQLMEQVQEAEDLLSDPEVCTDYERLLVCSEQLEQLKNREDACTLELDALYNQLSEWDE